MPGRRWSPRGRFETGWRRRLHTWNGLKLTPTQRSGAPELVETREDGWWPVAREHKGPERTVEAIDDEPRPAERALDMLASGGGSGDW